MNDDIKKVSRQVNVSKKNKVIRKTRKFYPNNTELAKKAMSSMQESLNQYQSTKPNHKCKTSRIPQMITDSIAENPKIVY